MFFVLFLLSIIIMRAPRACRNFACADRICFVQAARLPGLQLSQGMQGTAGQGRREGRGKGGGTGDAGRKERAGNRGSQTKNNKTQLNTQKQCVKQSPG